MNALLLVDIQNDFLPGGALPVKDGFEILPAVNELLTYPFDIYVASKDWHPQDHISFAVNHGKAVGEKVMHQDIEQILWPLHCVQHTEGSDFALGWPSEKINKIILKGSDRNIDSYSAFFDNRHLKATGLHDYLQQNQVKEVYIGGLTTDYCVKNSVMDALELGYKVYVIIDACRGVNLRPEDSEIALSQMEKAGAIIVTLKEAEKNLKQGF